MAVNKDIRNDLFALPRRDNLLTHRIIPYNSSFDEYQGISLIQYLDTFHYGIWLCKWSVSVILTLIPKSLENGLFLQCILEVSILSFR